MASQPFARHRGLHEGNGRLVGRSAESAKADVAQLAERVLGKDEVSSSILDIGSRHDDTHGRAARVRYSNSGDEAPGVKIERTRRRTWLKRNSTAASRT